VSRVCLPTGRSYQRRLLSQATLPRQRTGGTSNETPRKMTGSGEPGEGVPHPGSDGPHRQLPPAPPHAGEESAAGVPRVLESSRKTSGCFEDEALYELEGGGYCPVQPLPHDHGVSMGCALLTWTNTAHLPHPLHVETPSENVQQPEVSLSYNPEEVIPLNFIDLQCVKDMRVGGALVDQREIAELVSCARRYGLQCSKSPYNMISVVALMSQAKLADRSLAWLKTKYIG
ncbi:Endonuclease-reverse transcriptase HmRTE-e01, partial [Operophtera brumata]